MKRSLKTSIKSISRNPVYSLFLFIAIVIIAFMLFAGIIIDESLSLGMSNMEKRLGADLMLVPTGTSEDATNILLEGLRSTFYFNRSLLEEVRTVDGISKVSAQFFLKSLSADCCSSEVEIVFYDPDTDFIVAPWISKEYSSSLDVDTVIVGYSVNMQSNGTIKLFGREYKVGAKMAKTGTSLDTSVYFTFDALESVVDAAMNNGAFLTENQKSTDLISSIYINIADGYSEDEVLENIYNVAGDDFDVVYPRQLAKNLSTNLEGIYATTHTMIFACGILLFIILIIVNSIIANDRKREIAMFRVFGVPRGKLLILLNTGPCLVSVFGGLVGCLLASLFILPFGNYIGDKLDMSYLGPDVLTVVLLYVVIIVVMAVINFVTSIIPTLHISNLEPYIALRREGE